MITSNKQCDVGCCVGASKGADVDFFPKSVAHPSGRGHVDCPPVSPVMFSHDLTPGSQVARLASPGPGIQGSQMNG